MTSSYGSIFKPATSHVEKEFQAAFAQEGARHFEKYCSCCTIDQCLVTMVALTCIPSGIFLSLGLYIASKDHEWSEQSKTMLWIALMGEFCFFLPVAFSLCCLCAAVKIMDKK